MATPPTFIASNEGASWDTLAATRTTAAFNSAVGDVWVVGLLDAGHSDTFAAMPTNTGTAQTFTARGVVTNTDYTEIGSWTAIVGATLTSQTISEATSGGGGSNNRWNINVLRFSGSDGIGAVPAGEAETTNTAPSLTITTTADNSAIAVFIGDWQAADGTSRTWRTVNSITPTSGNGFERTYFRNSAEYAVHVAYYPDAGAAGAKTVGLSAPTLMKAAIVAVEIKGTAGGAAPTTQILMMPARSA